ncbi:BTB/POZ domain-containing protein SR1IP1-like [Dioscorea cayenensis subsp. rotundata]|uniref:BTB/POZ domain-containing protein SR1IP1-like n=1 Tax=Dioscorea cayennensis subsp. rotundata TaxID=55577 RepID=A0AB40D2B2_DIOCR|nr:BTB/POZ domain-containing protein SR1IP1-like [Dioscorea cayenensis subsp. rotundata]
MLSVDQEIAPTSAANLKRTHRLSTAMQRTSEWIFSQDIPSDITVLAGGAAFSLHKFPLVSKCGYIRKLMLEAGNSSDISVTDISDIPGGAEAFEFAAKFCYGMNFEISAENVAMLRCAAEYLEMTEAYSDGNLINRTEAYLEEVAMLSLSGAVTVLRKAESLLPMSEKVKLVNRCIDAVAYLACNDSQFSLSLDSQESLSSSLSQPRLIVDWWAEELTVLKISTFQRLLMALKARGFKQVAFGPVLMLYVQKSLRGLDLFSGARKKNELKLEHERRLVLETIASLLPTERNAMSVSFVSMLLRAALYLETTVACRLDLEKRMGLQLGQAVLDDLLIPSYSPDADTIFDVETVKRILMKYLEQNTDSFRIGYNTDDDYVSSPLNDMDIVGQLMERYLAEIASDHNLPISKFVSLAELIPEQARFREDGMYRAIDVFLKAHPSLSDPERKRICNLMDCQKLSREACAHAAQNERLPVQIVVQVLYHEQHRFKDRMSGSYFGGESPALSRQMNPYNTHFNTPDELSRLRRENDDLKLELLRMRAPVKDIDQPSMNESTSSDRPPLLKKSFLSSVTKKLSRLYLFSRSESVKSLSGKTGRKTPKDRRHSIS